MGRMTWLTLPILAAFCLYFFGVIRRTGLLTADSVFVYIQLLMAVGSLPLLDPARPADRVYSIVITYTILGYMAGSALLHLGRSRQRPTADQLRVATFRPTAHTWVVVLISVAIVALYFRAVGYSALFRGISNAATGGSGDVAGLRIDSYAGSRYLFPGYVNQFKNALLPALAVVVVTYCIRAKTLRTVGVIGLGGISLFGLLGTGQRGAVVLFAVTGMIYVYLLEKRAFPRRGVLLLALVLPIIIVSTLALGRTTSNLAPDVGVGGRSVAALAEFRGRVLQDNQESAVVGFRYIYDRPVQNGAEWKLAFSGLLPGSRGTDLPNRIFAVLYGTPRGTAPPSLWGSIYHNFGFGGIVLAPWLLAYGICAVTHFGTKPKQRNTLEVIGIAGTFTAIGFWAAGDPTYLLNVGLVVYLFLWCVGSQHGIQKEVDCCPTPPATMVRVRLDASDIRRSSQNQQDLLGNHSGRQVGAWPPVTGVTRLRRVVGQRWARV